MPSFADSIFLFVLALLLFGPKKLPVLARELGKWMGEFRRASNEFKMQMEDELRNMEQADRQKQIAAMESAAPIAPPLSDPPAPARHTTADAEARPEDEPSLLSAATPVEVAAESADLPASDAVPGEENEVRPVPIAVSGSLKMMPPSTGLPVARGTASGALGSLVDAIPETPSKESHVQQAGTEAESVAHGD